jgi:hypothetical protein
VQHITLAVLGASIVLLAFYDSYLGFVATGDPPHVWGFLFVVSKRPNPVSLLQILNTEMMVG